MLPICLLFIFTLIVWFYLLWTPSVNLRCDINERRLCPDKQSIIMILVDCMKKPQNITPLCKERDKWSGSLWSTALISPCTNIIFNFLSVIFLLCISLLLLRNIGLMIVRLLHLSSSLLPNLTWCFILCFLVWLTHSKTYHNVSTR